MNNNTLANKLISLGFVEGERDVKNPTWYADLGTPVTGLWYGSRVFEGQYQYVSLCSYLGEFVEAVVQVYDKPFNSRQKPPQTPLYSGLERSLSDLPTVITTKYLPPKKPA